MNVFEYRGGGDARRELALIKAKYVLGRLGLSSESLRKKNILVLSIDQRGDYDTLPVLIDEDKSEAKVNFARFEHVEDAGLISNYDFIFEETDISPAYHRPQNPEEYNWEYLASLVKEMKPGSEYRKNIPLALSEFPQPKAYFDQLIIFLQSVLGEGVEVSTFISAEPEHDFYEEDIHEQSLVIAKLP